MPPLVACDNEITTKTEVRYGAITGGGGFVVQKMDLDPDNLGRVLAPDGVPVTFLGIPSPTTENWLQLAIDLPEIIEILGIDK